MGRSKEVIHYKQDVCIHAHAHSVYACIYMYINNSLIGWHANYTHIEIVYTSYLSPCIVYLYSVVQCYMWFVHTPLSPVMYISM